MIGERARRLKHVVVLSHPDTKSFNAAVAEHYCRTVGALGHEAQLRDLYAIGFDPVLKANERPTSAQFAPAGDVAAEIEMIRDADVVVLIYPIWFGMPPAMLKGYVDRVLGAGFTHNAVHDRSPHFLSGKRLLSFTSSGTSRQWLEEQGAYLSLRNLFDDYLRNAFSLAAADHVHFPWIVPGLGQRFVDEHLWKVEETARRLTSAVLMDVAAPVSTVASRSSTA